MTIQGDEAIEALQECLAYAVLGEYQTWLGIPSPACLSSFLRGACSRAHLVGEAVPQWRVFGPLCAEGFTEALAERMQHTSLVQHGWMSVLENSCFCLADSMNALADVMRCWVAQHGRGPETEVRRFVGEQGLELSAHLDTIARRPAMYFGKTSGWVLRCYLVGMDLGGDWLRLRPLQELKAIVAVIEAKSQQLWGSKYAIYRVHEDSPRTILGLVGIGPGSMECA